MRIRRRKSRSDQVIELLNNYLKLKAVTAAAKGAGQAAKRTPPSKGIPLVAVVAGVAALVVFKVVKGGGGESESESDSAPVGA